MITQDTTTILTPLVYGQLSTSHAWSTWQHRLARFSLTLREDLYELGSIPLCIVDVVTFDTI